MLKFISTICLFFIINSYAEFDYNITNKSNITSSNLLTFELDPDSKNDSDPEPYWNNVFTSKLAAIGQSLQLTYLAKHFTTDNTKLLKNKYHHISPRAPPLSYHSIS